MIKILRRISVLLVLSLSLTVIAKEKDWGPFDRLLVTQSFLDSIYPSLKDERGLLLLRAQEFHAATGAHVGIDVIPCHPGSGISNDKPFQPCVGLYPAGPSEFLSLEISFSIQHPIWMFRARGSFADAKSKPVEKEIIAHPEWNQQQMIDAVLRVNPRFGPDNKKEFLQIVPIEAIFKFTGCRLLLEAESTVFDASRVEVAPNPPFAGFDWRISGQRQGKGKLHKNDSCVARFEPFDGKLLSISNM